MIPENKKAAVERALTEAFGSADVDDIVPLTGGLTTALVFRIVVSGTPYLLRLVMPGAPAGGDPARQFACMKIAADAGIAPRIVYASVQDQLLLTSFVERKPFPDDAATHIASTLRRLHALDGFPKTIDYLQVMDGLVRRFQASQLLPENVTGDFFRGYDAATTAYPRNSDMVGCHNDLRSENILFDGTRVWLVDWEAAFLNDRFVDLSWASTFFVHDENAEGGYLKAYFGDVVSESARARFYLMRVLVRCFAAALILSISARAGVPISADIELPTSREFHRRLVGREINLERSEIKRDYGLLHFREAVDEMRSKRFTDAIARLRPN